MARSLPPPFLNAAEEWDRLADQQEHATDLNKEYAGYVGLLSGFLRGSQRVSALCFY